MTTFSSAKKTCPLANWKLWQSKLSIVFALKIRTPPCSLTPALDVAIAVGADGVHLRSDDISPQDVFDVYKTRREGLRGAGALAREVLHGADTPFDSAQGRPVRENAASPIIGVSCHIPDEVVRAASHATFAVFGPVFGKNGASPTGLGALRDACGHGIPVLALGGITLENANSCLQAGAAGIAAIRLFQENKIAEIVRKLR